MAERGADKLVWRGEAGGETDVTNSWNFSNVLPSFSRLGNSETEALSFFFPFEFRYTFWFFALVLRYLKDLALPARAILASSPLF